jgi:hypothetical protein
MLMQRVIIFFVVALSFSPLLSKEVFALTISPTKIETAADPGQQLIGEIELFNEQSETKTFYTSFENFEPRGESGSPFFTGADEGLARWISAQQEITINPGERITIPYTLTVPGDATPGGYFAAIFFGSQPPNTEGGGEVAIGGKVGSLVLLRVNGAISESGGLLDFTTASNTKLFSSVPIGFSYRFNNTGGDRVVPKGEIKIKNTFGKEVAALSVNKNEGSVLPGSTRKFSVEWTDDTTVAINFFAQVWQQVTHFHFGFYRATLEATWGESNQRGSDTIWFLLVPWQLLGLVLALLIGLRVFFRFYNRLIISRARRR